MHNVLLFSAILVALTPAYANQITFIGKAYDPETQVFLYREQHTMTLDQSGDYLFGKVTYFNDLGEAIAVKNKQYNEIVTMPSLEFSETIGEKSYQAELVGDKVLLSYVDESKNVKSEVSLIDGIPNVIDGGFDRLIHENWDSLIKGKSLEFAFLAISRADFYRFILITVSKDDTNIVLKLSPSSTFLRWLVDPIFLTYDLSTKRLMEFNGLTNIRKHNQGKVENENYVAIIRYEYF